MPYIGPDANFANYQRYIYTATGGETSKSGADDNSKSLSFTSGVNVTVHLNGVMLVSGSDYNTGTSNTIAGLAALSAGDILEVTVYGLFSIADVVPSTGGTFSGDVIFSKALQGNTLTDTSNSGSVTLDFDTYQNFVLTLTGNVTLANPSTEAVGQSGFMVLIQDGTGSRTLSLGTDYETAAGGGITLSTTASARDIVPYVVSASGSILLGAPQLAFS
tara:strand:- start:2260 stop:2913 length:654 start_codon:yes stop_codon:yes gene_type:complete